MKPLERANDSLDALASEFNLDNILVSELRKILHSLYAQTMKLKK